MSQEQQAGDWNNGGDVALLVDWENLKFSLDQRQRRPNVTALRDAAERFGRIVYARAYADWQDPVHRDDPASLYMAGLEPVYVLTKRYVDGAGEVRIKNSVDVKLAADCIEASHSFPNVQTYIIVSGDHGFVHVVNTLRPHGKRVVVIGVSWTTAAQLTDQADVVLYYDIDVEPPVPEGGGPRPVMAPTPAAAAAAVKIGQAPVKLAPALAAAADTAVRLVRSNGSGPELDARQVADILNLALTISKEYREANRDFSVSLLGQELQKRMPPAEFARTGKGRARLLAQALEAHGFIRLISRDFVDWIFMPDEPADLISATAPVSFEGPRYDYTGFVYTDLAPDKRDALIMAINNERLRPGTDWLTFKRVQGAAAQVVDRDEYALKNLVNNMIVVGVLRFDQPRQGRDPETGQVYEYKTISLDLQHNDVRQALKLG